MTFRVADCKKEAAFYVALRAGRCTPTTARGQCSTSSRGARWCSGRFPTESFEATAPAGSADRRGGPVHAVMESFGFAIDKWNAKIVEQELRARGLTPVADNGENGRESLHVKDSDR